MDSGGRGSLPVVEPGPAFVIRFFGADRKTGGGSPSESCLRVRSVPSFQSYPRIPASSLARSTRRSAASANKRALAAPVAGHTAAAGAILSSAGDKLALPFPHK